MDSNLRCDEAVLASPLHPQNMSLSRGFDSPSETIDNLNMQQTNYDEVEQTPHFADFFIPHFIKAYRDRAILDDSRVFSIMLALEEWYIPDTDLYYCGSHQNEIKLHMRKIVADWMLDVCVDQRCQVNVFLLATNIMDRFLGTIALRKNQFQLLGAASIFLASKMVEPTPVSATTLVKCTADTYDREELLSMELLILSKLKWDVTAITAYDYLDHLIIALKKSIYNDEESEGISHHDNNMKNETQSSLNQLLDSSSVRINAEKIILLCATDYRFANLPPSVVASAALMSAIQQEICQNQQKQKQLRSIIIQEHNAINYSTSSSSCVANQSRQMMHSSSSKRDINLNQIVARLQILTRVQTNNLKLTISLIDQLFVIPLSTDNEETKNNSANSASNQGSSSPNEDTKMDSNTTDNMTPETSFGQQNYNPDARRSPPPSQTPSSSPIPYTSTPTSSSRMEDVFIPSSPPRASSSPIAMRKELSRQDIGIEARSSSYCQEYSTSPPISSKIIASETPRKDNIVITSPKEASSIIKGSVTICALKNSQHCEGKCKKLCKDVEEDDVDSKEGGSNSNVKSGNFVSLSWGSTDPHNIQNDTNAAERQHKCKKGDTPTEVFKVAALYVT